MYQELADKYLKDRRVNAIAIEGIFNFAEWLDRESAQQSVHPTARNVREIETVCPNCNLVFDVPVPGSHSG